MAQTYRQAIAEAKARYAEHQKETAVDALFIAEEYSKPLATVCKEIAGDEWSALEARSRRMRKAVGAQPEDLRRARKEASDGARIRHAKAVLKDPEQAAEVFKDSKLRDAAIDAVGKALGQTRARPAKINLEPIFGPFQKLGSELAAVRKHLPDVAPDTFLEDAEDICNNLRMTADVIDKWTRGESFADEVEDYLKGVS